MHQKITTFFQGFPQDGLAENGRLQHSVLSRSYDLKDEWIQVQGNPPTWGMPADHSGCFGKRQMFLENAVEFMRDEDLTLTV